MKSSLLHWSARAGLLQQVLKTRRDRPLVLMYHGISAQDRFEGLRNAADLHLPRSHFIQHLLLLRRLRRVIGISELVDGLRNGKDMTNTVVLTFDDGYANNVLHAAPLLADLQMPASFFLATSFIGTGEWIWTDKLEHLLGNTTRGRLSWQGQDLALQNLEDRRLALHSIKARLKTLEVAMRDEQVAAISGMLDVPLRDPIEDYRFMDWAQARSLVDAGFEVGAHTRNHAILSRVTDDQATAEINGSRQDVIAGTGQCCPVFCYPNGKKADISDATVKICQQYFDAAITTEHGHPVADRLFEMPRYSVGGTGAALAASLFRAR